MLSDKLTDLMVKRAKPGRYRDGKGLILLVKPSGSKSWVLRVQHNGKRRDYGLGSVDTVPLAEARQKAREGRAWVKQGKDPAAEWANLSRIVPTFRDTAIECHEALKGDWRSDKHTKQWLSTLERFAFPLIGSMSVDQIDVDELASVLKPIWLSKPETARRVRHRMGVVLNYAKAKKLRETPAPIDSLAFVLPKQMNARKALYKKQPSVPYAELPKYMGKLRSLDNTVPRLALAFQILTAARTNEVRYARWSEFDLQKRLWELPAHRMKTNEPHSVYLSDAALMVLDELKSLGLMSLDDLTFVGATGGAMSNKAMLKVFQALGAVTENGDPATVHGNRATFRTWAQEQCPDVPHVVSEMSIAHKQPNATVASYARGKFEDKRRDLMERWAGFVAGNSDNVVRIMG